MFYGSVDVFFKMQVGGSSATAVILRIFEIDRRDAMDGIDPKMCTVCTTPSVRADGKVGIGGFGDHLDRKSPALIARLDLFGNVWCGKLCD